MIRGSISGVEQLVAKVNELERAVRTKILRRSMNAATKPVLKEAKAKCPVRTGTLKKALGRKVKVYRGSGVVVGIVGPRVGHEAEVNGKRVDAVKYAHLVEYGTSRAPARPFLRPAYDATKKQAQDTIGQTLMAGLEDVARGGKG